MAWMSSGVTNPAPRKAASTRAQRITASVARGEETLMGALTFAQDIGAKYLGGVICPGVHISMEALFDRASKLHRVEIARPKSVIGKTTTGAIQSGLLYGYAGVVDSMVERIRGEMKTLIEELGFEGDFAAFLDHIERKADGPIELILNGDIFDFETKFIFLRTESPAPRADGTVPASNDYQLIVSVALEID